MRSLQQLRNLLLDIIPEIRSGKIEVNKANAICAATNSIINLTKLEVDYLGSQDDAFKSDFIIEPVDQIVKELENKQKVPYEFNKNFKD
ncbi:MAG: hypothetical protein JSR97_01875 [Verrucomicrobia bacterium]|nr:hypothetical protein [Verrucomicrobiota bacterium]